MRLIVALLLCCLCVSPAWSMEPIPRPVDFNIGAQPLSSALLQFSGQSGIQVLSADTQLAERRVRSLRGSMLPATALRRLLAGTGMSFRQVDAGTIVLVRAGETPPARVNSWVAARNGEVEAAADAVEADPASQEMEEVHITGTRIQLPGNYTAPNPMVSITGEELRQLGIVNVGEAITTLLPQNMSTFQPTLTGDDMEGTIARGSFFVGNTITNLRGLDPLFGSRTLTMIDGRRVVSTSNQADVVDLNIIPSNLLQRIDVVTGGASATYGSGAMAGVVNLVLDNRLSGLNVDFDYGINEAGDGASPHIALAGGMPLFNGRGHALVGIEWQNQSAIRDCAAAREWCARSRTLFQNYSGAESSAFAVLNPLPGFEGYPARFEMTGVRYSQFAPTGTIYSSSAANTTGYRFSADGAGIEEYAYGYRGGTGRNTTNGDGPLVTSGQAIRPSTERGTLFTNFEYELSERLTGYLQGSYARTDSLNRNRFTQGTACVRFNSPGIAAVPGGAARAGDFIAYGGNGEAFRDPVTGALYQDLAPVRNPLWSNPNFRSALGNAPNGRVAPYFIAPGQLGSSNTEPPGTHAAGWTFTNGVDPVWQRVTSGQGTAYWNLVGVTLTVDFEDPGAPAVLPALGRNAYAFLNQLSPEALHAVQSAFGNSSSAGGGAGIDTLFGPTPCSGFTAIRKVWSPQIQQWTSNESETLRAVAGLKGRFGGDWRWESYYQYGQTDSTSKQNSVQTNLSLAFAMDAVIDDRPTIGGVANPRYLQPICRIQRDGIPVIDYQGRPLSDPEGLAALVQGCRPLNIFGTDYSDPAAAQLQQQALAYAFKESVSDGANSLQVLSFNASGTLWRGFAPGPMTGAFGLELREDRVDNKGSRGPFYLRADIGRAWGDAFGGRTRVTEGYTELNLPLVGDLPGLNLWSVNAGARYALYNNKGGAGTTGQSATQGTLNWKFSTVLEPFDWLRLRLTRSRDLRAAGYRELFLNQPGVPDSGSGSNPWRERTADSTENQRERWGTVSVGNSGLEPEKSDTLTLGLVLSPGGWASGMRFSTDYYNIKVKDGIYTPYDYTNPLAACWEGSGNVAPRYLDGEVDPNEPGVNGLLDLDVPACREIAFATNEDGSRNLDDIVSYNFNRPANDLPYQRRGLDLSLSYSFPLAAALEGMPGSMSVTVRATRALESSGLRQVCAGNTTIDGVQVCTESLERVDHVGQIRSGVFIPGVSALPDWTGNIIGAYRVGGLMASVSARYVGGAKLDNTWTDDPADPDYLNAAGQILTGSVDDNRVAPYLNFSLNGSWDLQVANVRQVQLFGTVNNLFDKSPPFTGGGISGATAQYHDTMGRAYRVGVRMKF